MTIHKWQFRCGCGGEVLVSVEADDHESAKTKAEDAIRKLGWVTTPDGYPTIACSIECCMKFALEWERDKLRRHAAWRELTKKN